MKPKWVKKIKLDGGTKTIHELQYDNCRPAYQIYDDEGPFMTLSCNLPDAPLEYGEFFVKDWSENAPYIEEIFKSGLFVNTGKSCATGFVVAPVWKRKDWK